MSLARKKKIFVSNLFVEKGDTKSDIDLIYFKNLSYALRMIIPFFFDPGKDVLDVTTGRKKSWNKSLFDVKNIDDEEYFCKNVIFMDGSVESDGDVIADFRRIPLPDQSVDIIYFDPAFTPIANSQERHGITTSRKADREYYFRGIGNKWIPPEAYFFQTWREFNRVSRNGLIIKISERFEKLEEVPVLTYMDLAYNKRFNKKSEFQRCVNVGYRGKRAGTGRFNANPQRVLSNYAVYKKNRRLR